MADVIKRYIGIDFGTSTSVVQYKDYYPGSNNSEPPKCITFDQDQRKHVVTAVWEHNGVEPKFGYDALRKVRRDPEGLKKEFKMDLVSSDPEKRPEAGRLMRAFICYLRQCYLESVEFPPGLEEFTYISYPAKWGPSIRELTIQAAVDAGFKNVASLDEPTAAMQYLLSYDTKEMLELRRLGIVKRGAELNILLLDMGAGTTDLVLYRYIVEETGKNQLLGTWPRMDSEKTFGGREVDNLLFEWLKPYLDQYVSSPSPAKYRLIKQRCKEWKEDEIAPALRDNDTVDEVPGFLIPYLRPEETYFPPLDRTELGNILAGLLPTLPALINEFLADCIERGKLKSAGNIDLVVLTGGHSQWYFVPEILKGNWVPGLPGGSETGSGVDLPSIREQSCRLLVPPHPQETVAMGLASMGNPIDFGKIMSNNVWIKLDIGISATEPVKIVDAGERLPIKNREIQVEVPFITAPLSDIPGNCRVYVGETFKKAMLIETTEFAIGVIMTIKAIQLLGVIFTMDYRDTGTAQITLNANVSGEQTLTIDGLIKSSWFDETQFTIVGKR